MLTPPTNRSATRLQFFVQNWKQTTQDTWTLQTIQGYKIPFCRRPGQRRMRVTRVKCHSDAYHMEKAIKDLLAKGAVREVKPQDNQFSSTPIPASSVTTWAGTEGDSPLNLPGTQRTRVVGLREPLPSKWLSNSASTHRSHSLERCLENGLGAAYQGISTGGHWGVEEAQWHINVLELQAATLALKTFQSAVPRGSTSSAQTHSLENRQHHSGGVHQRERGHALPCSECTSPRVVGSRSIIDSSAYSRHSKCGGRHSLQADRDQNRMDIGTGRSSGPFIRDSTHQKWTSLHPV